MITYNDIYEILRKEKYSEALQQLPKSFISEIASYLNEKKEQSAKEDDLFNDNSAKTKKQLENSIAIFKELILRRKKKILSLVFVAAETGIMKRDYENMQIFEKDIFDRFVKAFEDADKQLSKMMSGGGETESKDTNRLILFNQIVEPFVDMSGKLIGPFSSGDLVNLDVKTSEILVQGGKAQFVDEN